MTAQACPTCGHKPRAARARGQEDRSGFPSLYCDHPRSAIRPMTDAEAVTVETTRASWDAHRAAGEFPVYVGAASVEWRKVAQVYR